MAKGIVINISGSGEGAAEALRMIEQKMQETAEVGEASSLQLQEAWGRVQTAFGAVGMGFGIQQAIQGIRSMVDSSIELGEQLDHLHAATGISINDLSTLRLMAMENGVDFDSLAKAFKKLGTSVFELHENDRLARDAFAALGLTVKDVDSAGGDMYKLLGMIADRFRTMPDGVTKSAVATELLGRQSQDLVGILDQGSEAIDEIKARAPIFSETDIARMDQMRQASADLKVSWQQLSLEVTSDLAPALERFANETSHVLEQWRAASGHMFKAAIGQLIGFYDPQKEEAAADAAIKARAQSGSKSHLVPSAPEGRKAVPEIGGSSVQERQQEEMPGMSAALRKSRLAYFLGTGVQSKVQQFWKDFYDKQAAQNEKMAQEQMQTWISSASASPESLEAFNQAHAQVQKQVVEKQPGEGEVEAYRQISGFMEDFSAQAIRGRVNFKSLVDSALMDLDRWAMGVMEQRAIIPMLNSLFGVTAGSAGQAASGAGASSGFAGWFAKGGDIDSGWAVVGDGGDGSGAEIFAPKGPGTVLPHDVLEGIAAARNNGGGAPNVTVNTINNSSQPVQQRTAGVSWDAQAKQFVIHTVLEDMQTGGPMSAALSGFASK